MRPSLVVALLAALLTPLAPAYLSAQELADLRRLPPPHSVDIADANWPLPGILPAQTYDAAQVSYDFAPPVAQAPTATGEYDFPVAACPSTYVQADLLYWQRIGSGCDDLLVFNSTTGDPLLSTGNLFFNGNGGFRVLVGWRPNPCCCPNCSAWEASYFGLWGMNANRSVSGPGNLAIPGDLGLSSNNFFLADTIGVNYSSQINNVELNCIKSCCLCCSTSIDFLCGFRYFNLNEKMTITGTDLQEGTSNYQVQTFNHLLGLQLGGRYNRQFASQWGYQLTGKAGVFYNAVEQTQQVTDFPNTGGGPFFLRDPISAKGSAVAALGELDFILTRRLSNTWSLRLGYTVIGVGGLALAADQLDFTDTFSSGSGLHNTGWIFIHGGTAGLEARW